MDHSVSMKSGRLDKRLIAMALFCVIIYTSYKLLKMVRFLSILYSLSESFTVMWGIQLKVLTYNTLLKYIFDTNVSTCYFQYLC